MRIRVIIRILPLTHSNPLLCACVCAHACLHLEGRASLHACAKIFNNISDTCFLSLASCIQLARDMHTLDSKGPTQTASASASTHEAKDSRSGSARNHVRVKHAQQRLGRVVCVDTTHCEPLRDAPPEVTILTKRLTSDETAIHTLSQDVNQVRRAPVVCDDAERCEPLRDAPCEATILDDQAFKR